MPKERSRAYELSGTGVLEHTHACFRIRCPIYGITATVCITIVIRLASAKPSAPNLANANALLTSKHPRSSANTTPATGAFNDQMAWPTVILIAVRTVDAATTMSTFD